MLRAESSNGDWAEIDSVLVQDMHHGLEEVIVGYRNDPQVGPLVLLGLGGVAAELRMGHSVRVAPVSLETAWAMIEEIPELKRLRGYPHLPCGDCHALAHAIRALSMLACLQSRRVSEAEINPLIIKGQ